MLARIQESQTSMMYLAFFFISILAFTITRRIQFIRQILKGERNELKKTLLSYSVSELVEESVFTVEMLFSDLALLRLMWVVYVDG